MHILFILFLIATGVAFLGQMSDAYTTTVGLKLGAQETNAPLAIVNRPWFLYGLKALITLGPLILIFILGYDSAVLGPLIAVESLAAGFGIYAGIHNWAAIKVQKQYNSAAKV